MTLSWGLGIEKETAVIGYNDSLKDFKFNNRRPDTNFKTRYIKEGVDGTVVGSLEYGGTLEASLNMLPKVQIMGYHIDVEKRAKNKMIGKFNHKRTIPFGSIPYADAGTSGVPASFHMNMTMPYDKVEKENETRGAIYIKKYKETLKKGMLNVRMIMPLIQAMIGAGNQNMIGHPKYLEGGLRQIYSNAVSGIGVAPLSQTASNNFPFEFLDEHDYERHTGEKSDNELSVKYPSDSQKQDKWRQPFIKEYGLLTPTNMQGVGHSAFADVLIKQGGIYDSKIPTVEFRFFDGFDTRGMYDVFKFMALAMSNGERTPIFDDPTNNKVWEETMKNIIKEGWNTKLSIEYCKYIRTEMKLSAISFPDKLKYLRADLLLTKVIKALYDVNYDSLWYKTWVKDKKLPVIHNFNKDAWNMYFVTEIKRNPTLKNKIIKFLLILNKINANKSHGKISVIWNNKQFGLRDVILDDKVIGVDFGFEDTEDLLFALEKYKFLETFYNDGGKVIYVKRKFTTIEEMKSLFEDMINEKEMITEDEGLITAAELKYFKDNFYTRPLEYKEPGERVIVIEEAAIRQTQIPSPARPANNQVIGVDLVDNGDRIAPADRESELNTIMTQVYRGLTNNYKKIVVITRFAFAPITSNLPLFIDTASPDTFYIYLNSRYPASMSNIMTITQANSLKGLARLTLSGLSMGIPVRERETWSPELKSFRTIFNIDYALFESRVLDEIVLWENPKNNNSKYGNIGNIEPLSLEGETVTLNNAGIQRLKNAGIYIISINRKTYKFISYDSKLRVSDKKPIQIKGIGKVKVLNNIPYWKNMYAIIKRDGEIILRKKGDKKIYSRIIPKGGV